ncbi:Branched-chain amino acid permease [Bacillus toyonensis]|uniref:Branched-chain amino acid permease n=2 Tax=Bacillus toyonensis TaxID=155322 RepID=A0A2C4QMS9_9BACI|nr:Branched-chain amino acid permease [Bacillus toyonensis]
MEDIFMKLSNKKLIFGGIGILILLFIRGLYNSYKMYEATTEPYRTFDVVGEAIAGTLSWFSIITLIASIIFLIIALIRKKQLEYVKRPFLRPLAVFGVSAVSFILLIITGMVLALNFHVKDQHTTSLPKLDTVYKETDDTSKEIDKLKGDISLLETQNKTLDAEVKRLKEELAKKEQPKKEESKRETQQPAAQPEKKEEPKQQQQQQQQQQSTGSFANPVKDINKTKAINRVKEKAKQDFKDDYMTQNFVASEQTKAYDFLYGIEIKSQEELNIMKNALKDFPNDFMTAKFVYEEQMKAKNQQ